MDWLVIPAVIVVAIIVVALMRNYHTNYRIGEGLFKSSEYNLDEKEDFVDKIYYHEDGMFK